MGPLRLRGRPRAQRAPLAARPCRGHPEAGGGAPQPTGAPQAFLCLAGSRSVLRKGVHISPPLSLPLARCISPPGSLSQLGLSGSRAGGCRAVLEEWERQWLEMITLPTPAPAGLLHRTRFQTPAVLSKESPKGGINGRFSKDARVKCVCDGENTQTSLFYQRFLQPRAAAPRSPCPRPDPFGGNSVIVGRLGEDHRGGPFPPCQSSPSPLLAVLTWAGVAHLSFWLCPCPSFQGGSRV